MICIELRSNAAWSLVRKIGRGERRFCVSELHSSSRLEPEPDFDILFTFS